jgi:diguanylate cyclase (GGDEF)-like protein/PAS domain S-box-containing protein
VIVNSPLPIGVYAASGQCVLVNDAYATLVGTTRDALLTQNMHDIATWKASGLLDDCLRAMTSRQPQTREIHIESSFGNEVWVDCRIIPTPLKGENHLLIQFVDLTERKRAEETLRNFAFHDALTMLPNRRLLLDRLSQALRASKRLNSHIGVLFIDLDKFKSLNDARGHEVGDRLLVEVANRLRTIVRETDTVARLGGDEFVVLLVGLGETQDSAAAHTTRVTEKIRHALDAEYQLGELTYRGSASVGVKLFLGEDGDPDRILKEADMDMYASKKSKRRPRLVS